MPTDEHPRETVPSTAGTRGGQGRRGAEPPWLSRGVGAIGSASLLADLGHEIPTALLPSFLTSTLGAPAAALGLVEGLADGLAGIARFAGGPLADDPHRRRDTAVAGYTATAVLTAAVGLATSVWQVALLRAGGWAARGLRVPSRNALLADVVPASAYGRAYGFERAMDNLGAIGGPLLALALVGLVGVRSAILLSVVPGLLAVVAIVIAVRSAPRLGVRERRPLRIQVRPVLRGRLGRLFVGIGAFEFGNAATTLLILRGTELLEIDRGHDEAVKLVLLLYAGYNLAATLASIGGGHVSDLHGNVRVLSFGVAAFFGVYVGFGIVGPTLVGLALLFIGAGIGIGLVETAEHAAVASHAPERIRGSAFGLLAATQSLGNLAASAIAGAIWTFASPSVAFLYLAAWMALGLAALAFAARSRSCAG